VTKRDREAVWSAINRCRCALCRNARDVAWIETGASPTSDMAERIALAIATARAEGAAEERERAANVCRRCGGRGIVPASEHGRRPAPRIVCPSCGGRVVR
jgi:hypothetical protein